MEKFQHSAPVKRLYKKAAKIAQQVVENGANLKTLVYADKRPQDIQAMYALVAESLQHADQINLLLKRTQLLEKEPRFNPWLARILITELLWRKKKLVGDSKPIQTLLAYQEALSEHFAEVRATEQDERKVTKPRYVRVNRLKISVKDAIDIFTSKGWTFLQYNKTDYEKFLRIVSNLSGKEFLLDIHIDDLLVFPPKTQLYNQDAYLNGSIVLQDKASCLPVQILNPPPNSTVLDMCAAPGIKTFNAAANMNNKGVIYAVDLNEKRFEVLTKLMNHLGVTCVTATNTDVLSLTKNDCPNVEYILVDPSCSGSGIVDRVDYNYPTKQSSEDRLRKLAGFQILILKHALRNFPKANRVVYSTCSVHPEENEAVVEDVLRSCTSFELVPAADALKMKWSSFGSSEYGDVGKKCLYAKPEVDHTNGFFVAVFQRKTERANDVPTDEQKKSRKRKKHGAFKGETEANKKNESAVVATEAPQENGNTEGDVVSKKKRKEQKSSKSIAGALHDIEGKEVSKNKHKKGTSKNTDTSRASSPPGNVFKTTTDQILDQESTVVVVSKKHLKKKRPLKQVDANDGQQGLETFKIPLASSKKKNRKRKLSGEAASADDKRKPKKARKSND